jgi:nucleotide-binding universal stress UspA family protein
MRCPKADREFGPDVKKALDCGRQIAQDTKSAVEMSFLPTPTSLLVVVSGDGRDQTAIEMASRLARRYGARMAVVTVQNRLPRAFQQISLVIDPGELWQMATQERALYLATLVSGQSVPSGIETRALFGDTIKEIVREVSRERHDLAIVPGSHWTRHLPAWIRFDLASRLARRRRCPVRTTDSHDQDPMWRSRGVGSIMVR